MNKKTIILGVIAVVIASALVFQAYIVFKMRQSVAEQAANWGVVMSFGKTYPQSVLNGLKVGLEEEKKAEKTDTTKNQK